MKAQDFCYWLQGFVEMNPSAMLTLTQWQIVKDHLKLVFEKETPDRQPDSRRLPISVPTGPAKPIFDGGVLREGWPNPLKPDEPYSPPRPFMNPDWLKQWPPGTIIC